MFLMQHLLCHYNVTHLCSFIQLLQLDGYLVTMHPVVMANWSQCTPWLGLMLSCYDHMPLWQSWLRCRMLAESAIVGVLGKAVSTAPSYQRSKQLYSEGIVS